MTRLLKYLVAASTFAATAAHADDLIQLNQDPSKCIHKKYGHADNGNPLHLWSCDAGGPDNKSFYWDAETGYIHLLQDPTACVHKKFGDWNNGNPIHVWDCAAGSEDNKTWDYDADTGLIAARGNSAKCIHKKYGHTNNGNPLRLWDCAAGTSDNKSWTVPVDETIEVEETPDDYVVEDSDGVIDMGDFLIVYTASDQYVGDDGGIYVDGEVDVVFGPYTITLHSAMLELEEIDGTLTLVGGSAMDGFSSNIGGFAALDIIAPTGLDVEVGYGSGELIDDLGAPIDTTQSYFFLRIATESLALTDEISLGMGDAAGSILFMVEPTTPTIYGNVTGLFPDIPGAPISLEALGLGFSAADGLVWSPSVTWNVEDVMTEQRGNLWIDAIVDLEMAEVLNLRFDGEALADVDFDDLFDGEGDAVDSIEMLAGNLATSFYLDLQVLSVNMPLATASALYERDAGRVVVAGQTEDLSGFLGLADGLVDVQANVSLHMENETLRELRVDADVEFFDGVKVGNLDITVDNDSATIGGTLNLGFTQLEGSGTIDNLDFHMGGSKTYTLADGFAEVELAYDMSLTGFDASADVAVYNFVTGQHDIKIDASVSVTAAGRLEVCAGDYLCFYVDAIGDAITTLNNIANVSADIAAAIAEGWEIASGEVVDAAGDVVEGLEDFGGDVTDFLDDAADTVGDVIDDIGDGLSDAGDAIGDAGEDIGDAAEDAWCGIFGC